MGALPTLRAATDPGVIGGQYFGPDGFGEQRGYPEGRGVQPGVPRHRRAAPAVDGVRGADFGGLSRWLNVAGWEAMSLVVPPYPPARYTKDEPEVSAWLRRGTDPPDYDSFGLVKYHYLANQQATDGDYGLYRVDIAPNGGGPGPHFHRAMSEAFFVLSGRSSSTTAPTGSTDTRTTSSTFRPAASTASATRPTRRRRS